MNSKKRQRSFVIAVSAVLFLFSGYLSINYYAFQVMPTSDMPAFLATGRTVLSGHMPDDLKRGPVLGVLQVLASYVVGGQMPELTAGYLLNALVFPFTILLMWLVGRAIAGNAAIWPAILAAVNPWVIKLLPDPIAETMLLSFIMITFYLVTRRSRWAYVLASAASMLRYECAALILAVFIVDVIERKEMRQRLKSFGCMVLASLPLAFWLLQTVLNWQNQEASHYIKIFSSEYARYFGDVPIEKRVGILKNLDVLWQVGFSPLLMVAPGSSQSAANFLEMSSKVIVCLAFGFGAIWGLFKKNWNIAALLVFLVPYVIIHAKYPYPIPRYYSTVFWIVMIIAVYGCAQLWSLAKQYSRIPTWAVVVMQFAAAVIALLWINELAPALEQYNQASPQSGSVPVAAVLCLVAVVLAYAAFYRNKLVFNSIIISVVMGLMLVSNQFTLAAVVRDGQREAEFKYLADWYVETVRPPQKIALYMAGMTQLFVPPEIRPYMVHLPVAKDKADFVKMCREQGIRYIVWASREGFNPNTEYWHIRRLDNIDNLNVTADAGPFRFVRQISSKYGYLNIFSLADADINHEGQK